MTKKEPERSRCRQCRLMLPVAALNDDKRCPSCAVQEPLIPLSEAT
jgi:hypothetical protein